jgi:hypothetical protein
MYRVVFIIGRDFVLCVVGTEVKENIKHSNVSPFTNEVQKIGNVNLYEISTGNIISRTVKLEKK